VKVGLVSTHPPLQCGIATYTRKLSAALARDPSGVRPVILSEQGGAEVDPAIPCEPCFRRGQEFGPAIAEAAARQGIRVAHFQHAADIFGFGGRLLRALRLLQGQGIATVVTLHTVFTRLSGLIERKPFVVRFHRGLAQSASAVVVHSETSRRILVAHGMPQQLIDLIPHGTDEPARGDAAAGRRILGVEAGEPVLLFFGFVHMQKNVQVLLRALKLVVRQVPDVRLAIVGKPGGDAWFNRLYARWLARLSSKLGLERNVVIVDRFVEDPEAIDIHAASLMMLLPHNQGYGSASGVVHSAMAMGLPLLCSDSIKFEEVGTHVSPDLLVSARDPRAWARKIIELLEDEGRRQRIAERVREYARQTHWSEVAREHTAVYRRVADGATPSGGRGR
jgi:glycosyltransferase involved in cell wall biosynthesis